MTRHLLVTNDFPPKVGGIQSYLWELWRRLPPDEVTVLTTPYAGTETFDAAQLLVKADKAKDKADRAVQEVKDLRQRYQTAVAP